jgi:hypothetical protein
VFSSIRIDHDRAASTEDERHRRTVRQHHAP